MTVMLLDPAIRMDGCFEEGVMWAVGILKVLVRRVISGQKPPSEPAQQPYLRLRPRQ
jgi:hypothetical protein